MFDKLWDDGEEFQIGNLKGEVMYLLGHTPDHVGYKVERNVFTGDSIFNLDVGPARADFPGDCGLPHRNFLRFQKTSLYTGRDYFSCHPRDD